MKKEILICILLIVVTIPIIFPFFGKSYIDSIDARYRLTKSAKYYIALHERQIPPRWMGDVNQGLGEPTFVYTHPFVYILIGFIHGVLNLSLVRAINLLYIVSVVLSGITIYIFLRSFFGQLSSFAGAAIYIWSPYRMTQIFERGVLEETFTLGLMPLNFFFVHRILQGKKLAWIGGAIVLAMTISTHFLVSYVFLPIIIFFFFCLYKGLIAQKKQILARFICYLFLAITLSSFALFPVLFERGYIHFNEAIQNIYKSNFIPVGNFLAVMNNHSLYTPLGFSYVIAIIAFIFLLVKNRSHNYKHYTVGIFSFIVLAVSSILIIKSELASLVWEIIPLIRNVNFPAIFYTASIFSGSILIAYLIANTKSKMLVIVFIIMAVVSVLPYMGLKKTIPAPPDEYLYIYAGATTYFDEFIPVWAQKSRAGSVENRYPYFLSLNNDINFVIKDKKYHRLLLDTNSEKEDILVFKNFYFPGWIISIDGKTYLPNVTFGNEGDYIRFSRKKIMDENSPDFVSETSIDKGLMSIKVPPGKHTITFTFTETTVRKLSNVLSIFSVVIITIYLVYVIYKQRKKRLLNLWKKNI